MATVARNQVYSDLYAARAAEVEHTGVFNPSRCNDRAAVYVANAFDALVRELESNADRQAEYAALHEAAAACDAASYGLVQPTAAAQTGFTHHRQGVYGANLALLCTNATAVHATRPVTAEKSAVYENLFEQVNFEMKPKASSSSARAGVYAANAQIFEAKPSDINTPRARAVEARQATYETVCAEHDLFATAAKASSARAGVYAANAQLYTSAAPVRENTLPAHADVYSAMPAEVFEQKSVRERPSAAYRAGVYSANTELYDHVNFSLRAKEGSYRADVYAANKDTMFVAKPKVSSSYSVYKPANITEYTNKKLVSSKGSVYMSAASRVIQSAAAAASSSPMSPARVRSGGIPRTDSSSSLSKMSLSGSVTDLAALVQSPTLIRSTSHQDMQQLASVSFIALDDAIAEVDGEAPAAPAPMSPRSMIRAGHMSSAVSRMAKLGY